MFNFKTIWRPFFNKRLRLYGSTAARYTRSVDVLFKKRNWKRTKFRYTGRLMVNRFIYEMAARVVSEEIYDRRNVLKLTNESY